jgi:hypothetical protein
MKREQKGRPAAPKDPSASEREGRQIGGPLQPPSNFRNLYFPNQFPTFMIKIKVNQGKPWVVQNPIP